MPDSGEPPLTPEALVEALTGAPPYAWQKRLLVEHLMRGEIPSALDVPTGLGKTRVMALWFAARALGARDAVGRRLPARLVYVVDRRAVVDQATEEAMNLAEALPRALEQLGAEGATAAWTALGLQPPEDRPAKDGPRTGDGLPISTLRGQFLDNKRWLEAPGSAAIVVGTVDMIGSRLLFSGYGVGRGMRPAHAGLLGCDTLVLLDEAHLSQPFQALLHTVAAAPRPEPLPGLRVMSLSATPAGTAEGAPASARWRSGMRTGGAAAGPKPAPVFSLQPDDWEQDEATRKRLAAVKRLRLEPLDGKDDDRRLAQAALHLAAEGGQPRRVVVFCNRRDKRDDGVGPSAQGMLEEVTRAAKADKLDVETLMLVGARRVLERQTVSDKLKALGFVGTAQPTAKPAVLVATSAGEVGVDLDADHMVCDLVAWERMVQRLGRVNRRGEGEAQVRVFHAVESAQDALAPRMAQASAARTLLQRLPADGDAVQASPLALRELAARAGADAGLAGLIQAATTPAPLRPELGEAAALALAMTRVKQHTGRPSVQPFLRGWVDDRPQTRIIWRRLLPVRAREGGSGASEPKLTRQDETLLGEVFEAFPPHLSEVLETEARLAAGLLKARVTAVFKRDDIPADLKRLAAVVLAPDNSLDAAFSLGFINDEDAKRLETRLAGRTLVLDARLGGLDGEGLLDTKAGEPPATLDAANPAGPGEAGWDEQALQQVGRRLREIDTRPAKGGEEAEEQERKAAAPQAAPAEPWVRQASWPMSLDDGGTGGVWQVERWAATPEEGDAARASKPQGLADHQTQAKAAAEAIAEALDLPSDIREAVVTAAAVHDDGKARRLWQTAMGAPRDKKGPYAKTDGKRAATALLNGYRHEFGSLLSAAPALENLSENVRDLAKHLVVAHHGYGRPVITPLDPEEPPSASEARAHEVALRFARLQAQWGPWGLAWLEALVRAADWKASRDHQAGEDADG